MSLRSLPSAILCALLAAPATFFAQTTTPDTGASTEDERLEALARSSEAEFAVPKNSVSVGFKFLTSGARVHFGKLGYIPFPDVMPAPASEGGSVRRNYDNGSVDVDSPRSTEVDADGNQTSTPGQHYQTYATATNDVTDASGNVIGTTTDTKQSGDFLSYTPGLTRQWAYSTPQQTTELPGYIAMSNYSATSEGAALDKKQGPAGGVELQFAHTMGKLSRRTEWSLVAGMSLNGINNKTAGDVHSTLHTNTDYFSLNGQTAPTLPVTTDPDTGVTSTTAYAAPTFADFIDANGNVVTTNGQETTVPLSSVPASNKVTDAAGAATVHGRWQVRGAYFMMRVGPSVRTQLTERLGLSATIGLAGAYAGTHYTADETLDFPDNGTSTTVNDASDSTKFLAGYYADFNLEFAANERTGLFGGLSAQKFGDYDQTVNTRTARIDLGTSVGIRGGISIKF